MRKKLLAAMAAVAGAAALAAAPARADRQSVCETVDGLWSERSEFVQITGRAACELTPETPGSTFLQLQYEYPSDVADDAAGSKQLAAWLKSRIAVYQGQLAGARDGDERQIAVGATYEEQSAGAARTVVFTETAFTKGNRQPVTQKLTQTFTLSAPPPVAGAPDGAAPDSAAPAPGAPVPGAPAPAVPPIAAPASPATTAPAAPAPATPAASAKPPKTSVKPLR
ncbi:hypothetical protein Srot_0268 [Segniliparus rotundus DSM 44985]|uniref:Uncharacterized protein n=1 Tax=Segniliparus rotundus (strain ATCC BAA-972 / CDC 1076 / CIP 108378 / DSM 44985 / JCM 13578) TaxID=640132 RepID=D6ZAZ6_SEGRD|nr:hypothetical protein [Segniliparus rotundus]ADG96755.1 hypothetical protein Srot_0268 [Segniliparus rotundus DSM 44985]